MEGGFLDPADEFAVVAAAGRDVCLVAHDRLDARLLGRSVELDGPEHVPVVGHRHGGHSVLGGGLDQFGDSTRPVEERIVAVDVQVHEAIACGHGRLLLDPGTSYSEAGAWSGAPHTRGWAIN